MPGHVLQLAHSASATESRVADLRKALWSGPFVEGWAVYAEELMVGAGYGADAGQNDALRMQQLKMQLRMTINAILDARVHAHGMTEDEAMSLMTVRGHQEDGEAAGKWRRALLTSGAAVDVLRRLRRGGRHRARPRRGAARPVGPGAPRRDARARLTAAATPAHPARPLTRPLAGIGALCCPQGEPVPGARPRRR